VEDGAKGVVGSENPLWVPWTVAEAGQGSMDTGREAAMSDGDTLKISSDCQPPMAANLR